MKFLNKNKNISMEESNVKGKESPKKTQRKFSRKKKDTVYNIKEEDLAYPVEEEMQVETRTGAETQATNGEGTRDEQRDESTNTEPMKKKDKKFFRVRKSTKGKANVTDKLAKPPVEAKEGLDENKGELENGEDVNGAETAEVKGTKKEKKSFFPLRKPKEHKEKVQKAGEDAADTKEKTKKSKSASKKKGGLVSRLRKNKKSTDDIVDTVSGNENNEDINSEKHVETPVDISSDDKDEGEVHDTKPEEVLEPKTDQGEVEEENEENREPEEVIDTAPKVETVTESLDEVDEKLDSAEPTVNEVSEKEEKKSTEQQEDDERPEEEKPIEEGKDSTAENKILCTTEELPIGEVTPVVDTDIQTDETVVDSETPQTDETNTPESSPARLPQKHDDREDEQQASNREIETKIEEKSAEEICTTGFLCSFFE